MNLLPTIKIIPLEVEYEDPEKIYFKGIFKVLLNNTVSIAFVPYANYNLFPFPPYLPIESVEDISSVEIAKLYTILTEKYSVCSLPSSNVHGLEVYHYIKNEDENLIFILSKSELNEMLQDLEKLYDLQCKSYPQSSLEYSIVKEYTVVKFINEQIIMHKNFGKYEKKILGI